MPASRRHLATVAWWTPYLLPASASDRSLLASTTSAINESGRRLRDVRYALIEFGSVSPARRRTEATVPTGILRLVAIDLNESPSRRMVTISVFGAQLRDTTLSGFWPPHEPAISRRLQVRRLPEAATSTERSPLRLNLSTATCGACAGHAGAIPNAHAPGCDRVSLRARVSTWRLGRRPIWRKAVARPSCKLMIIRT